MAERVGIQKDFGEATEGNTNPSVAYAEAVMNGNPVVTVTDHNGNEYTYHIGHEWRVA